MASTLRKLAVTTPFALSEAKLQALVEDLVQEELRKYNTLKSTLDLRLRAWEQLAYIIDGVGLGYDYHTEADLGVLLDPAVAFPEFFPPSIRSRYDANIPGIPGLSTTRLLYRGTRIDYDTYLQRCNPDYCVNLAPSPRYSSSELTLMMMSLMTAFYSAQIVTIVKILVKAVAKKRPDIFLRIGELRVAQFTSRMLLPAKLPAIPGDRGGDESASQPTETEDATTKNESQKPSSPPLDQAALDGVRRTRFVRVGTSVVVFLVTLILAIPLWASLVPDVSRAFFKTVSLTYSPTNSDEFMRAISSNFSTTLPALRCNVPEVAAGAFIDSITSPINVTGCSFSHVNWFSTNPCAIGDTTCSKLARLAHVYDNLCRTRNMLSSSSRQMILNTNVEVLQRPSLAFLAYAPYSTEWNASLAAYMNKVFETDLKVAVILVDMIQLQALILCESFITVLTTFQLAHRIFSHISSGLADPYNVTMNPSFAIVSFPPRYPLLSQFPQSAWDTAVTTNFGHWGGTVSGTHCLYQRIQDASSTEQFTVVGAIFGGVTCFVIILTPCVTGGLVALSARYLDGGGGSDNDDDGKNPRKQTGTKEVGSSSDINMLAVNPLHYGKGRRKKDFVVEEDLTVEQC